MEGVHLCLKPYLTCPPLRSVFFLFLAIFLFRFCLDFLIQILPKFVDSLQQPWNTWPSSHILFVGSVDGMQVVLGGMLAQGVKRSRCLLPSARSMDTPGRPSSPFAHADNKAQSDPPGPWPEGETPRAYRHRLSGGTTGSSPADKAWAPGTKQWRLSPTTRGHPFFRRRSSR